jgi:integrase
MQHGSLIRSIRKHGPDVWQFRWSETGGSGQRVYRKRVIGKVEQYSDAAEALRFAAGILALPSPADLPTRPVAMTIAELGQHFQHRELARDDNWRSYSTRRNYEFNLRRWIIPRWGNYELAQAPPTDVESWLRNLPLARISCTKIRSLMSVLFNHAWRHELYHRNPIKLVRQSTKRRSAPMSWPPLKSSSSWIILTSENEPWFWW